MLWGYETWFTVVLSIVGFIIILWAQTTVNSSYKKYKKIKTTKGLSGQEVARAILDRNGLKDIYVVETRGELSDHYDPSRKVIRLSKEIFHGDTIAAAAVAAHECGHAIQDKDGYIFMKIRSFLVPVVNLVTYIGYIVAFISIFAGATGYLKISILMILAALLFQLVTLPVEFDASKRANEELLKLNLVSHDEVIQTKSMLKSAALTYVASFISSLLNLLRLVIMLNDRD
ncbi:MAG: zinc metallopeptidase [Firmicutes bacterium]|nr:zinc metallopeptidase [Bacillota bacterium]